MVIRVNYLRKNIMYDIDVKHDVAREMKRGDYVIVRFKEDKREEVATIVFMHDFETQEHDAPDFLRKATEEDLQKIDTIKKEQEEAFHLFIKLIEKHNLNMKPVAVFMSFGGKFGDFLFSADERIDFRELVKDLTKSIKKKIFLEQVGPRDRAGLIDGCGSCGRRLCCSTFLKDRPAVTMTAVRGQNLFYKDREKLTGLCGKLKCCLNYELGVYHELSQAFPPMHADVKIKSTGERGVIIGRSILDQQVRIGLDGMPPKTVPLTDVETLKKEKHPSHKEKASA